MPQREPVALSPIAGVRLATPQDLPDLASVLARAFADDPYLAFLTSGDKQRVERLRAGWMGILRYASADLVATYTTDDRAGVAIWLPPRYPVRSRIDSVRLILAMARMRGWRRLRAGSDTVRQIAARRRHHVPGEHYYLEGLAVDVGRRRKWDWQRTLAADPKPMRREWPSRVSRDDEPGERPTL